MVCIAQTYRTEQSTCLSLPPEDRNMSIFRNVVFYLFRIMNDGHSSETQQMWRAFLFIICFRSDRPKDDSGNFKIPQRQDIYAYMSRRRDDLSRPRSLIL
jgi:hypothetical protein